MSYIVAYYGLMGAGFVVLLLLGWLVYDRRYGSKKDSAEQRRPSPGFQSTQEVFIDPKDGLTYRVYYNARSGEREYILED